jgi:capsular exopolysaccharide synthesis family protein
MSDQFSAPGASEPLTEYVETFRRRKWWMVLAVIVVVAGSVYYVRTQQKEYTATSQLLAQENVDSYGVMPTFAPSQLATFVYLVTSPGVSKTARNILKAKGPIHAHVSAAVDGTTNLLSVSATSAKPAVAARVANAFAQAFTDYELGAARRNAQVNVNLYASELATYEKQLKSVENNPKDTQEQISLTSQIYNVQQSLSSAQQTETNPTNPISVIAQAVVPTSPSSPDQRRDLIIALLGGILLAVSLALLIDYLDDRIRTGSDTEKVVGNLLALTAVPMVESWKKKKDAVLVSISDPSSSVVEAYWSLRASLNFLAQGQTLKTIVVTSPAAGEGKTATVANLGVVAANGGQKAVIVSCDLRRPRLSNFFGQPLAQGLMNVVRGEVTLEDAVKPAPGVPGLWILDSGPLPPDPHRVLNSQAAREMFEELALNFDWVLIDTPPLLPVADSLVLAQMADATVIVATYGQTKKRQLRRALNSLETAHVEPLGMILNEVTKDAGYGYGYGYG